MTAGEMAKLIEALRGAEPREVERLAAALEAAATLAEAASNEGRRCNRGALAVRLLKLMRPARRPALH